MPVGEFDGYASRFGEPDLGRDVVASGAFGDSLQSRGGAAGIRLLWQHDPAQPLGVWTDIRQDQHGLYVRGALNLSVEPQPSGFFSDAGTTSPCNRQVFLQL
jgi:HK97 family phage prohead protease